MLCSGWAEGSWFVLGILFGVTSREDCYHLNYLPVADLTVPTLRFLPPPQPPVTLLCFLLSDVI